jgi:hypothetical protein
MADVLFVLITIASFSLLVLLVKACDRIIGPDEPVVDTEVSAGREEVAP